MPETERSQSNAATWWAGTRASASRISPILRRRYDSGLEQQSKQNANQQMQAKLTRRRVGCGPVVTEVSLLSVDLAAAASSEAVELAAVSSVVAVEADF